MEEIEAADVRQANLQNLLWLLCVIVQELMRRLYIHEDRLHPWTPGPQIRDTPSLAAPADCDRIPKPATTASPMRLLHLSLRLLKESWGARTLLQKLLLILP